MQHPSTKGRSGNPLGSIIIWPVDYKPKWLDEKIYHECDGSSFDTNIYKRLAQLYPNGHLPNYQGLFLRGAGTQEYTQINGIFNNPENPGVWTGGAPSTTHYSSSSVGTIQGDASRPFAMGIKSLLQFDTFNDAMFQYNGSDDGTQWYTFYGINTMLRGWAPTYRGWENNFGGKRNFEIFLPTRPQHFKYRLNGNKENGYELEEYKEDFSNDEGIRRDDATISSYVFGNNTNRSTTTEIRPVNVAVKYYIKMK